MSVKEILEELITFDDSIDKYCFLEEKVEELHKGKKYKEIVELYKNELCTNLMNYSFEVAYALNEVGKYGDAEAVYSNVLETDENNTAVLNNLSNLKDKKGLYQEAFELIAKAYAIDESDEIVKRNYENRKRKIEEIEAKECRFRESAERVKIENSFVRAKLKNFIDSSKTDKEFKSNRMPIPKWKFKVMMKTDEIKAESLLNQWMTKDYIIKTDEKEDNFVSIYEINPYIDRALKEVIEEQINPKWILSIELFNQDELKRIEYYELKKRIEKTNGKIREILTRDIDELVVNYLFENYKSVIVLSGSIIEASLLAYCSKNTIEEIQYELGNKQIQKRVIDCDLGDLLSFFEQKKIFKSQITHLGNVSRLYRNFIHPGREIKEEDVLDKSKADICFIVVREILKNVL